jgi:uncharacterized Ntn-hydrolase superfamily protein
MTYSIVARDPSTGYLGIAVASRFFTVGARVPWVQGRVGAIASQAFTNPTYGSDGLKMMQAGAPPDAIVQALITRDNGHANRQFHMIDALGRNAAYTGLQCIDWAGHELAENVSVAGNMLEGPQVVAETLREYQAAMDKPFAERLLLAMQAGEDAGGDKRGKQAAGLVIYRDQDYSWLDIRTDDHADPLAELRRLYAVAQERYIPYTELQPTRENPHGVLDRTAFDAEIARIEAERAASGGQSASFAADKL